MVPDPSPGANLAGDLSARIPASIRCRLRLPLIAAPMRRVSGVELVAAACKAGVIGSFPTVNAYDPGQAGLDTWLSEMRARIADSDGPGAPICPNLIVRRPNVHEDLDICINHGVEMVITSVGTPKPLMPKLRDAGIKVFADVATLDHAKKARDVGVDGLILLTAGAGGQTGWLNGFAYARAVREIFDGVIVMAGGIIDGVALRAAEVLGCDLAYMGTKFIATNESMAASGYRDMLVSSTIDDISLTSAFTGLPGSFLRPSIDAAGIRQADLDEEISRQKAATRYGSGSSGPQRWSGIWSAGHTVSGVRGIGTVQELVDRTAAEYSSL